MVFISTLRVQSQAIYKWFASARAKAHKGIIVTKDVFVEGRSHVEIPVSTFLLLA